MIEVTTNNIKDGILQVKDSDVLIIDENKPLFVMIDYEKYKRLEKYINNIPNEETIEAIKEVEEKKNLTSFKSSKELFDDLGI